MNHCLQAESGEREAVIGIVAVSQKSFQIAAGTSTMVVVVDFAEKSDEVRMSKTAQNLLVLD